MKIEAWFDGACGPINPGGHAGYGALIKIDGESAWFDTGYCGHGPKMSNNVAEYSGLIAILDKLRDFPPSEVIIRGDSMMVIEQMSGRRKAKSGLYLEYCWRAKDLLSEVRKHHDSIRFEWIPREQNTECDALSKDACK